MNGKGVLRGSRLTLATRWFLFAVLTGAGLLSQASSQALPKDEQVVARVNGTALTEGQLADEIENLYPSNSAHGGITPSKMEEIRAKALEEVIVEELAWQRAVKTHAVVPRAKARAEYARLRVKYGAEAFDRSMKASDLTQEQYLGVLQRRMTLEQEFKRDVYLPSRVRSEAVRAYYRQNRKKFLRPEQVHARLILAAVDTKGGPDSDRKAKEKIQKVYAELKAGKDFASLAQEYSDDFYRVKGGDIGWAHRGRLEPEFEKVAFSLPVGKFSEPFHTKYGYSVMKVEERQPAHQMSYQEVRQMLKAELEQKKLQELRQAWVAKLKNGAQIEIVQEKHAPHAAQ
jgi:parvulin-like peptidyl-prolyl isomerase